MRARHHFMEESTASRFGGNLSGVQARIRKTTMDSGGCIRSQKEVNHTPIVSIICTEADVIEYLLTHSTPGT